MDGLLYANSLSYWDYIHLDTLLSLQTPRTDFDDEIVFIVYHQITELYFKLVRIELKKIRQAFAQERDDEALRRIERVYAYFRALTGSFEVMIEGMDPEEFLKFRMSLLPASGFQSVQYRKIEISMTDLGQLTRPDLRDKLKNAKIEKLYDNIYWKSGNLELKTGKKTLTLRMFEERYDAELLAEAQSVEGTTLRDYYRRRLERAGFRPGVAPPADSPFFKFYDVFRKLDLQANLYWRFSHLRAATKYLKRDDGAVQATGGTNWQSYLPPRIQKIVYFPEVWTETELSEWGKQWAADLFKENVEKFWR
ncbi:MAG: tryptophan 2,3-dioxygenase family protein [Bacteroidia bacterium]|nr:tryptophan 2,3-dioxygenase family protein [Bacteroidia bacterium]